MYGWDMFEGHHLILLVRRHIHVVALLGLCTLYKCCFCRFSVWNFGNRLRTKWDIIISTSIDKIHIALLLPLIPASWKELKLKSLQGKSWLLPCNVIYVSFLWKLSTFSVSCIFDVSMRHIKTTSNVIPIQKTMHKVYESCCFTKSEILLYTCLLTLWPVGGNRPYNRGPAISHVWQRKNNLFNLLGLGSHIDAMIFLTFHRVKHDDWQGYTQEAFTDFTQGFFPRVFLWAPQYSRSTFLGHRSGRPYLFSR